MSKREWERGLRPYRRQEGQRQWGREKWGLNEGVRMAERTECVRESPKRHGRGGRKDRGSGHGGSERDSRQMVWDAQTERGHGRE